MGGALNGGEQLLAASAVPVCTALSLSFMDGVSFNISWILRSTCTEWAMSPRFICLSFLSTYVTTEFTALCAGKNFACLPSSTTRLVCNLSCVRGIWYCSFFWFEQIKSLLFLQFSPDIMKPLHLITNCYNFHFIFNTFMLCRYFTKNYREIFYEKEVVFFLDA